MIQTKQKTTQRTTMSFIVSSVFSLIAVSSSRPLCELVYASSMINPIKLYSHII